MAGGGGALRQLAARAERMADEWPRDAGELTQRTIDQQLKAATGGDGGFSRGRSLGRATVTVKPRAGGATVTASGSGAVWKIVEHGTGAHTVKAKGRGYLRTPYGPRRQVTVGGVRARHTWTKGVAAAIPQVRADAARTFSQVVS